MTNSVTFTTTASLALVLAGLLVGLVGSLTGLGGGSLMVPLLLWLGLTADRAVGTSFFAIVLIAVSAVAAHGRLNHVDYKTGALLAAGGVIGAQIGPRLLESVPAPVFTRLFGALLAALAVKMLLLR